MLLRSIVFLLIVVSVAGAQTRHFRFGSAEFTKFLRVSPSDLYSKEKGYGFEPGASIDCNDLLCTSNKPFYFSVAVPEGNYKVTVTLAAIDSTTNTTVKAELRRLMLENITLGTVKRPDAVTRSFIVNVRTPQISTGGEVKLKDREHTAEQWAWDEKLTLEFNGTHPAVRDIVIEKVNVPTVFLLGDSTVCDQPTEPYASWGQMLTRFFTNEVAIANHAESGDSLRSAQGAKRLDKILSQMKAGDYLLIQYAHNDEKEKGEGVGAFTTFKASLKYFTEEAKKKGASVILITPVQRQTFDANGKITNSHGDYPEAVRQAAKEENVPLIDLNAISKDLYETLGPKRSDILFKEGDHTHHNNYGAYEIAKIIVQAIKDRKLPLAKHLIKGLPDFDAHKPDSFESFDVPASPIFNATKPLGN